MLCDRFYGKKIFQLQNFCHFPDLNLSDLSLQTIDVIMSLPCNSDDLCAVVRRISKYICIQLSQDLEKENINALNAISTESESEPESESDGAY